MPTDSLRASICYPADSASFDQKTLEAALELAGVKDLIGQLDSVADWAKSLEFEQQQRLGLVRLLLQKPKWIMMQEPFSSLHPDSELAMVRLIYKLLPNSAILTISKQPAIQALQQRKITLC